MKATAKKNARSTANATHRAELAREVTRKAERTAAAAFPPIVSNPARTLGRVITLTERTEKKNFVLFSTGEWTAGAVNASVYVPKDRAEGVTSVVVALNR